MEKRSLLLALGFLCLGLLWPRSEIRAQNLILQARDLRIEQGADGGYHLYIRKKTGMASVLLTESTKDFTMQEDNYAYRSPLWNPVNGNEIRILEGTPIPREYQIWSLIDSTPETHPQLGECFHLYIPYIIEYGYADTRRSGEVYVVDGTYLNIRAFSLPYGDYRGVFQDNPFILRVTQKPLEGPPEGNYMKEAREAFQEIAVQGRGDLIYSSGPGDLVEKIKTILDEERGRELDMVLCLDTTGSMSNDIDAIRKTLIPMLETMIPGFKDFRIGMLLYKDYYEEYLTRAVPFTRDFAVFQQNLNAIQVRGGRDIPEAVHEALYDAAVKFPWGAESKLVILIGDAPPHLRQRGKISKDMAYQALAERGIRVHAIILPQ
jgi:hypothetical protein